MFWKANCDDDVGNKLEFRIGGLGGFGWNGIGNFGKKSAGDIDFGFTLSSPKTELSNTEDAKKIFVYFIFHKPNDCFCLKFLNFFGVLKIDGEHSSSSSSLLSFDFIVLVGLISS